MAFLLVDKNEISTVLGASRGRMTQFTTGMKDFVLAAVPDESLFSLEAPRLLSEGEALELLSPEARKALERLRREHPELLYWNAPLPPSPFIKSYFFLESPEMVSRASELIEREGGIDIETTRGNHAVMLGIPHPLGELQVSFLIPKEKYQALVRALAEEGIAGYDRAHQVFRQPDPDGAPPDL